MCESITNGADEEPEDDASSNLLLSIKQHVDSIIIRSLQHVVTGVELTHSYIN